MQTLEVFIASPGSAQEYWQTVKAGIRTWNELFLNERAAQFKALDWHDMVPAHRVGQSTQDQINKQLVDRANVLIAVFASTAGDKNTVEEIRHARDAEKNVFVYQALKDKPDHDLRKYVENELREGRPIGQFESHEDLVRQVIHALSTVVSPAIVIGALAEQAPASIERQLRPLGERAHVIVAGRTCVNWLTKPRSLEEVRRTVERGVRLTFVVQDLHDHLADPEFAGLTKDLADAVFGFNSLWPTLSPNRRSLLSLKYSPAEIRNGRTLILDAEGFKALRYDLTMARGSKPFVVFYDRILAEPLIQETLRLEQEAFGQEMLEHVERRRKLENRIRMAVADARSNHDFSSDLRGNRPSRLVRPAARWTVLSPGQRLPHPLSVQILLTTNCATHCAMCDYFNLLRPTEDAARHTPLKAADFIALLDDVAKLGTRAVTLSGGEPLILPDVVRVIEHARTRHLRVGILTSGLFGSRDFEDVINAVASCEWVQVSVDSFQKATYVGIRSVDNASDSISLDKCAGFLRAVRLRGLKNLEVVFTIQKRNIEELYNTSLLLKQIDEVVPIGIPVRFKFATGKGADKHGQPGSGEFLPSTDQLEELHARWGVWATASAARPINVDFIRRITADSSGRHALSSGYPMQPLLAELRQNGGPCEVMKHTMFIDSYGRVFPCCYLFNDNVAHWSLRDEYCVGVWTVDDAKRLDNGALLALWEATTYSGMRARKLSDLPGSACGRCTRHMKQNAFLADVNKALAAVTNDPVHRERALRIYEDPDDTSIRPVWL